MAAYPGRIIDLELIALDGGLFDTLPPAKPLTGRAVDHHVMRLQSGLFDALPPPPPLQQAYDSLAPVVAAELRGVAPAPAIAPRRGGRAATVLGACAGLALMALGVGLRHREAPDASPAAAAEPAIVAEAPAAARPTTAMPTATVVRPTTATPATTAVAITAAPEVATRPGQMIVLPEIVITGSLRPAASAPSTATPTVRPRPSVQATPQAPRTVR